MDYKLEDLGTGETLRQSLEEEFSIAEIEALESTIQPFIEIDATPSRKNQTFTIGQSRLGGFPDLPTGFDYPLLKEKPAALLAQINFAEIPQLEGFPEAGLLQFYLADQPLHKFDYRCNSGQQTNATMLFFPELLNHFATHVHYLPEFSSSFVPVAHTLKFEKKLAPASTADLEFEDLTIALEDYEFFGENYETLIGELAASDDESLVAASQLLNGGGHKLGGYPGFLQTDPRQDIFRAIDRNPDEPFELLLRLVSTREVNIGGFNLYFLIKRSDLLQRNFSNVVFYFDK